ncbi:MULTISPECIES: hypothetical protein [Serratia]|uniref:hypothetical protein n=1 Tax=Serratia TaxID=613 RepID=UPI0013DDC1BD|nr:MULTISPECIES: hypothetical protein [Serratia]
MNKPSNNDLDRYLSKIKAVKKQKFKIRYKFGGDEVEEFIKIDALLYTDPTTGTEYNVTYVDPDQLCFTNKENPKEEHVIYSKDKLGTWQCVP